MSLRMQVYCMFTCDRQWLSKWLLSCEWVQQHPKEMKFSWDELRICNSDGGSSSRVRSYSQDVQGSLGYLEMDRTQDHLSGASGYGTSTMWLSCFFVTVVLGHTLGKTVAYQQRERESRRRYWHYKDLDQLYWLGEFGGWCQQRQTGLEGIRVESWASDGPTPRLCTLFVRIRWTTSPALRSVSLR